MHPTCQGYLEDVHPTCQGYLEDVHPTCQGYLEDVLPDEEPGTASQRKRECKASNDESAIGFPADEKEGDQAVDYSEDSPAEEHFLLPGEGQKGILHSAEARQQAIEDVCATFVQNAGTVTTAAVSNNGNGKHEAEGQHEVMEISTVPVLNPSQALKQTDIMSLVENKDFRLKVPNISHDPQRSGLEE